MVPPSFAHKPFFSLKLGLEMEAEKEVLVPKEVEEKRASSKFRRVCVFCGSSSGKKASYQEATIELAKALVERNIDLVYGGGRMGLMGLVSQVVHNGGRHVLGVTPKALSDLKEITGETFGESLTVPDMHERKAVMARKSDAFIALPGGYGTLEELFEMLSFAQLRIHSKPVGLLNVNGFYDSFLSFIDFAVEEEFISDRSRRIIVSASSADELLRKMEEFVPQPDDLVLNLSWDAKQSEMAPGVASTS